MDSKRILYVFGETRHKICKDTTIQEGQFGPWDTPDPYRMGLHETYVMFIIFKCYL